MSGPLLDRIDIHLPVPAVPAADLSPSAAPARGFQGQPGVHANAHMVAREVRRYCRPSAPAESLLRRAVAKLGLSARAYTRVLKLARTIADLAGELEIGIPHVSEAIQYRVLDRSRAAAARI